MDDRTILDVIDEERLDAFVDAVNEGLGQFGADNQDVFDSVDLAAGSPHVEVLTFPTLPLALACVDRPESEWEDICRQLVHAWVDGTDQRAWMTAQPFAEVAGLLRPWLSHERTVTFQGDPDGPKQPWSEELLPGCWLSLFLDAPSASPELPEYPEFVPNQAVAAWGVSYEDLLEAARNRLRTQQCPEWRSGIYAHPEEDYSIEMYYLEQPEESDPIAVAWQLVLAEVAPKPLVPGTLIASPVRQVLMLSYPDPELTVERRRAVFDGWADRLWNDGDYGGSRVQGWTLRVDPGDHWRVMDDVHQPPA